MKLTLFDWVVTITLIGNIFAGIYDKSWHSIVGWCVATGYFFVYQMILSRKTDKVKK